MWPLGAGDTDGMVNRPSREQRVGQTDGRGRAQAGGGERGWRKGGAVCHGRGTGTRSWLLR